MASEEKCIFCKILGNTAPGSIVEKTKSCFVIMDSDPLHTGHVLIIPQKHLEYVDQLPDDIASDLFITAKNMLAAIKKSDIPCDGANLFISDGRVAGQEVRHVHLHLVPRSKGDNITIQAESPYEYHPQRADLDSIAKKIKLNY